MRRSDYTVFINKYRPLRVPDGGIRFYETFGKELEKVRAIDGQYVWIMIEVGDKWYISPGYHLVNRMYYIITEVPWKEGARDYLY